MNKEASFLKKTLNKYCWDFNYDKYTNLSFEIGAPQMHIREPRRIKAKSKRAQWRASCRGLVVVGEYSLWNMHGYWSIIRNNKTTVTSSSKKEDIVCALSELTGQKLTGVCIDNETGRTNFYFDLGARLVVRRWEKKSKEEVWSLISHSNGKHLCVYADGQIKLKKGTAPAVEY